MKKKEWIEKSGNGLIFLFILIMILRINSYFMISESAAVTRVFKTGTRVLLTGISLLILMRINNPDRPTIFNYRNILGLTLYIGYLFLGFASVLWSSDRFWSGLQLAMDIECVFFVMFYWKAFLTFNDQPMYRKPLTIDHVLWVSIFVVSVGFIIGMFAAPDTFFRGTHGGEVQRLGGWIINPNELGMLMTVGAGSLYVSMMRKGVSFWRVLAWISMVVALVMTQSRSSLISFFLVTIYMVMMSGKAKLIIPTITIGVLVAPVIFATIFVKDGDVDEVMSMTGRLPFWGDLLTYAWPKRMWQGYGFMRIHFDDKFPSIHAYPGAMTHNTFMQVLLNLGIMGALTCFFQMLFVVKAHFRQKKAIIQHTGVGIFVGIFINSLTEFGIFGDANYGIMWWLFIIFIYTISVKEKSGKKIRQLNYAT